MENMNEDNLDMIIVLNPINIRYLTGFMPSSASLLLIKDEPLLFISKMEMEDASNSSKFQIEEFKSLDGIKQLLGGKIGIERSMKIETFHRLKNDGSYDFKITSMIENMRQIKRSDEIEDITKALRIAEKSIQNIDFRRKNENEIAAKLEYNMRLNGSSRASFETIIASGHRSALPHASTSLETVERPVVIDWGATYNDYCSDTTRTIIENERHEEIFDVVLDAQKSAIKAVKPGVKASYIDKVARDVISEYGYEKAFIHSIGHGVGLEVHENPSLSKRSIEKLQKDMVITIEPGIYLENEFGIRIEDMIHITNRGNILNRISSKLNV